MQQNRAEVNEQIVTFHAPHAGNNFFFTRQAINILVIAIIIIIIIHAQLIHIHSRQNNTSRAHTHTRVSAQAYEHFPLQTHLPLHPGM